MKIAHFDENSPLRMLVGSMSLLMSYVAGKPVPWAVKNQNRHYKALMELLKNGYKEEACKRYMSYPCGRSVVKTALERINDSNGYKELKEKYPLKTMW
ncbi:MAG: hypothetical protein AABX31_05505 [Nanoarchaeota archaeon]